MKILEWNIRHGGSKDRIEQIIHALVANDPDTIVLVEYRENDNGSKIKSALYDNGWVYQAASNPPGKENGIFIASKKQARVTGSDGTLPKAGHRWLEVCFPDLSFSLVGVHIPGSTDKWDKKDFWTRICEFGERKKEKDYIIIGDFNTGLEDDYEGTPFQLSQYMRRLIDLGWIDTWRSENPNTKEFTWYSNKNNGFRVDYAFVTPSLRQRVIKTHHSNRERVEKYSDHSPLIIELI